MINWLNKEARFAAAAILNAISATHIVKQRPGFGQKIIPRLGSVLASPIPASYDPDPDYFFHWFRDSALVIDALRVALDLELIKDADAKKKLSEFVEFSYSLLQLDGRAFLHHNDYHSHTQTSFLQYLRNEADIANITKWTVLAETRVNPDGSIDITRWSRPQTDGSALSILTLLRWINDHTELNDELVAIIEKLIIDQLHFTCLNAHKMSFDIWEEENGFHYYNQLIQREALDKGAAWLTLKDITALASNCRCISDNLSAQLETYWDSSAGYIRSRHNVAQSNDDKSLDIAVIFAVIHSARLHGDNSVLDPKVQATLTALEELFEADYPINQLRPQNHGPALGRYKNDAYYSGGAYFFSTLAAAEFYFSLTVSLQRGGTLVILPENAKFCARLGLTKNSQPEEQIKSTLARGDAIMRMVQAYTLESGDLSEQFDQVTGAQTSAKHLTWSYAAFITAFAQRRHAALAIRD